MFAIGTTSTTKPRRRRRPKKPLEQVTPEEDWWGSLEKLNEANDVDLSLIDVHEAIIDDDFDDVVPPSLGEAFVEWREPEEEFAEDEEIAKGLAEVDAAQHDPLSLEKAADKIPEIPRPRTDEDDDFVEKGRKVAEEIEKAGLRDKKQPRDEQPGDDDELAASIIETFKKLGLKPPHVPDDDDAFDPAMAERFARLARADD